MRRHDLPTLLDELAQIRGLKVSLTFPTHRHEPESAQDPIRLKNLIKQASTQLEAQARSRDELAALKGQLDSVDGQIDYHQLDHGLAVFVAADLVRIVQLAHRPVERALVSDRFATRELHRDVTEAADAWVLALSSGGNDTDGTQLYHLHRGSLVEHRDEVLPADYDVRDRDSRFAETRPDSPQRDAYIETFLRRADEHVATIVGDEPVIVAGIERLRSHHRAVTTLTDQIVGDVDGNFDKKPLHDLAVAAEQCLQAAQVAAIERIASDIDDRATSTHVALGIDDCERLAREGRVEQLVLEHTYLEPVEVDNTVIGDRVEAAIRQVHEHRGKIVAVEDGRLAERGRIAATLRW